MSRDETDPRMDKGTANIGLIPTRLYGAIISSGSYPQPPPDPRSSHERKPVTRPLRHGEGSPGTNKPQLKYWSKRKTRDTKGGCRVTNTSTTQPAWNWQYRYPVHGIKAYSGSRGVAPLILNLGSRWRWVVSFAIRPPLLPRNNHRYPLNRMRGGSGGFGEEKNLLSVTGFEHRIVQPIAQSRAGEPFYLGGGGARAQLVYKCRRNLFACLWAVLKSKTGLGVCHNYY
jgi:hypothetical protein